MDFPLAAEGFLDQIDMFDDAWVHGRHLSGMVTTKYVVQVV